MNQVGHIFAKDVRRQWPEIAASVVLTAVFAWASGYREAAVVRTAGSVTYVGGLAAMAGLLALLVPVSWWVLITRAVQGESLVGDTQWWITKPYEWSRLLMAKALLIALFIVLPVLGAECWLLERAGFSAALHLGGLGWSLLMFAGLALAPLTALATVTSSLARMTLTMLGLVVVLIVAVSVLAFTHRDRMSLDLLAEPVFWVAVVLMLAAVVLQYARRRVWAARGLLALALVVWGLEAYFSTNGRLIAMTYSQQGAAAMPLSMTAVNGMPAYAVMNQEDGIALNVPVRIAGVPASYGVDLKGVRATIRTEDGRMWRSEWQPLGDQRFIQGESYRILPMEVSRSFYEAARAEPVTLRLELAAVRMRAGDTVQVAMPAGEFAVPGVGICTPASAWPRAGFRGIACRSAVRQPQLTRVTARWSDDACDEGGVAEEQNGVISAAWVGELMPGTAGANLNPVRVEGVPLPNPPKPPAMAPGTAMTAQVVPPRFLCAGTPLTFTPYRPEGRARYAVTMTDFRLPAALAISDQAAAIRRQ